jgi:hypothetical protein
MNKNSNIWSGPCVRAVRSLPVSEKEGRRRKKKRGKSKNEKKDKTNLVRREKKTPFPLANARAKKQLTRV